MATLPDVRDDDVDDDDDAWVDWARLEYEQHIQHVKDTKKLVEPPSLFDLRHQCALQHLQLTTQQNDNIVQMYRQLPLCQDIPAWFDLVAYCKSVNMSDVADEYVHNSMKSACLEIYGPMTQHCHHSCWETKFVAGVHQLNPGDGCMHTVCADLPDGYKLKIKICMGMSKGCHRMIFNPLSEWLVLAEFVNKKAVIDPPIFCELGKYYTVTADLPTDFKVRYSFLPERIRTLVNKRKHLFVDYPAANMTLVYQAGLINVYQRFERYATNPQNTLDGQKFWEGIYLTAYTDHADAHHVVRAEHAEHVENAGQPTS